MTLPETGSTLAGIRPRPALRFSAAFGPDTATAAGVPGIVATAGAEAMGEAAAPLMRAGVAMAISPGRMTRNGKNILGMAAMSGTRRADSSEFAAIAVWMTRKSVHQ